MVGGSEGHTVFLENVSEDARRVEVGMAKLQALTSCRKRKVGRETGSRQFAPTSGRNLVRRWSGRSGTLLRQQVGKRRWELEMESRGV